MLAKGARPFCYRVALRHDTLKAALPIILFPEYAFGHTCSHPMREFRNNLSKTVVKIC
jgi:hypothetical protein